MKRTWMLLAVVAAAGLPGCASPTIDKWCDRGLAGCAIERQNWREVAAQLAKGLDGRDAKSIDALFADIALARDKLLADVQAASEATTRPAATSRWLDEEWMESARKGLALQLKTMHADRKALAERMDTAEANIGELEKAFRMISKLRRSWGPISDLRIEVQHLAGVVEALLRKEKRDAD